MKTRRDLRVVLADAVLLIPELLIIFFVWALADPILALFHTLLLVFLRIVFRQMH